MKLQTFSQKFQFEYSKSNIKITSCVRFELDAIFKDDAGYFLRITKTAVGCQAAEGVSSFKKNLLWKNRR